MNKIYNAATDRSCVHAQQMNNEISKKKKALKGTV